MTVQKKLSSLAVWVALGVAGTMAAQEKTAAPAPTPRAVAPASEPARVLDVIVFKDGDRLQGKLVRKEGETLIFQSERFGELRVPASGAVVIKAEEHEHVAAKPVVAPKKDAAVVVGKPPAKPAKPVEPLTAEEQVEKAERTAADAADAEKVSLWDRFSPAVLTSTLREFFGPWRGKISVSTELVTDATERASVSSEIQLKRKWKYDEVELRARYDFAQTSELTTTDMVRANGLWRHEFKQKAFALYRPTIEWNRAVFKSGLPADYLSLQQEFGLGYRLIVKPSRTVRVGLSENLFDTWSLAGDKAHTSRTVESAFVEAELKLPWRMTLTDRSVYYYSIASQTDGWENSAELNKRFTETLSTSIRHEVRRGSPDNRVQDYTRLKLLVGLDF